MASKKKGGGGGGGHGGAGWVVTFADLMALLMALFVMIVSFSNSDEQKLHEAAGSIRDAFGYQAIARPAGMIERSGTPLREHARDTQPMSVADAVEFANRFSDSASRQGQEVDTNDFAKEATNKPAGYLTAAASLRQALQDLPDFAEVSKQILLTEDEEGLHIHITDQDGRPMFEAGSRQPVDRMRVVLGRIATVIGQFPGELKIIGHTEASSQPDRPGGPSWQLSGDRATTTAEILGNYGVAADRIAEIAGRADQDPLYPDDPYLSSNRRVELLILPDMPPMPMDNLFGAEP